MDMGCAKAMDCARVLPTPSRDYWGGDSCASVVQLGMEVGSVLSRALLV